MPGQFRKVVSVADKDISPGTENKETLSIELLPDGFSFAIFDESESRYRALEEIQIITERYVKYVPANLLEAGFRSLPLLSKSFVKVHVSCCATPLILLPPEVSDPEDQKTAFQLACADPMSQAIFTNKIHSADCLGVYALPAEVNELLKRFFPDHRLMHSGSVLIESTLSAARHYEPFPDIVMHIRRSIFEILIFEKETPVFYQLYHYQHFDDLLYYLFHVIEQLHLETGAMNMLLAGEIGADPERLNHLSIYFNRVFFAKRSEAYGYSSEFDALPNHYYNNLLNLNACG